MGPIDWEYISLKIQQTVNWTPSSRRIPIGEMLISDLKQRQQIIEADKQKIWIENYKVHDLIMVTEIGSSYGGSRKLSLLTENLGQIVSDVAVFRAADLIDTKMKMCKKREDQTTP
jgi:hypothetical protein